MSLLTVLRVLLRIVLLKGSSGVRFLRKGHDLAPRLGGSLCSTSCSPPVAYYLLRTTTYNLLRSASCSPSVAHRWK